MAELNLLNWTRKQTESVRVSSVRDPAGLGGRGKYYSSFNNSYSGTEERANLSYTRSTLIHSKNERSAS